MKTRHWFSFPCVSGLSLGLNGDKSDSFVMMFISNSRSSKISTYL